MCPTLCWPGRAAPQWCIYVAEADGEGVFGGVWMHLERGINTDGPSFGHCWTSIPRWASQGFWPFPCTSPPSNITGDGGAAAREGTERADRVAEGFGTGLQDMGDMATYGKTLGEAATITSSSSRVPRNYPVWTSPDAGGPAFGVEWLLGPAALIAVVWRMIGILRR